MRKKIVGLQSETICPDRDKTSITADVNRRILALTNDSPNGATQSRGCYAPIAYRG